jgi:subtilase family protein
VLTARPLLFVALLAATVTYAEPAYADAVRDGQWQLEQLRVTEAHERSRGEGVTVAVLDTGVDASHPDLRDNVLPGVDLTGGGSDGRDDPAGSGTALAGLIAGHGHGTTGGDGVLGLAPAAEILPVVIAAPGAWPDAATLAAGVDEAVRRGAGVICLGRAVPDDPAVTRAIGEAVAAGVVVVVPAVPAGDALARYGGLGVLGAVPTGPDDGPASGPAAGPGVVAVPGMDVLSTGGQGGYFVHERTSAAAAAALLAGAAALVRASFPNLAGHAVSHRVAATAGAGGLDMLAALTASVPTPPPVPPPPPPATSPPTATPPPATPAAQVVAAFDSQDWHRWLVGVPLVGFLVVLTAVSVAGARRARRARR